MDRPTAATDIAAPTDVAARAGRAERARDPWYRRPVGAVTAGVTACAGVAAAAFGIPAAAAAAVASAQTSAASGAESLAGSAPSAIDTIPGAGSAPGTAAPSGGFGTSGPSGSGATGSASAVTAATTADADESTGIVLIDTVLGYSSSAAAGTGMVLTSDGLVLTNNHVVESSTQITVTIATTGESYSAMVVGTDAEDDVALLQLQGASGLATVALDEDEESIGDVITAVGNAEGGGVLLAADGTITDLDATVTTAASGSLEGETLESMIEIAADVVSGDSGGAVLDAEGEVIGMTTAASSLGGVGYAIEIDDALAIVELILAGEEIDGIELGYPAFLGIGIAQTTASQSALPGGRTRQGSVTTPGTDTSTTSAGVTIAGVYEDTPAAEAGLAAGDTITAIDGAAVTNADSLTTILEGYDPGQTVTVTWTDTAGATHSAAVTLIAGPV